METKHELSGVERAIEAAGQADRNKRGRGRGQAALAALAGGVSQQAVSRWKRRGWMPVERAPAVSDATGVPVRDLVDPRIAEALGAAGGEE